MDKYKATKVLAKELAKHNGQIVISDRHYMKKLIDESEHAYVTGNPLEFGYKIYPTNTSSSRYKIYCLDPDKTQDRYDCLENFVKGQAPAEANYLFDSRDHKKSYDNWRKTDLTPYAIIGSKEIEDVKRLLYKNYDVEIRESISALGIQDYLQLFQAYSEDSKDFTRQHLELPKFCKQTIEFLKKLRFDSSDEVHQDEFKKIGGLDNLNSRLTNLKIDFDLQTRNSTTWIKKPNVTILTDLLNEKFEDNLELTIEFCKFAFEMPYEDQNIEINRCILNKYSKIVKLDTDIILLKEFQGKHFKKYFDALADKDKKRVVRMIKSSGMEDTENSSFLWSKGFKEVDLDHMDLYKKDTDEFIKYFQGKTAQEKRIIIKDAMACGTPNKDIEDWLAKNEIELVREASFLDK